MNSTALLMASASFRSFLGILTYWRDQPNTMATLAQHSTLMMRTAASLQDQLGSISKKFSKF